MNRLPDSIRDDIASIVESVFGPQPVTATPIEAATAWITADNATRPISARAADLVDTVQPAIMRDLAIRLARAGHHTAADTVHTWAETETSQ